MYTNVTFTQSLYSHKNMENVVRTKTSYIRILKENVLLGILASPLSTLIMK